MTNVKEFQARILVVDDEESIRNLLAMVLRRNRYAVDTAADGLEALNLFRKNQYDVVITDLKMPRMDGIQLLRSIKRTSKDVEIIVVTAYASRETAVEAMDLGASTYMAKPFDCLEIIPVIMQKTLERRRLMLENKRLIKKLRKVLAEKRQQLISLEEFTDSLAKIGDHHHLFKILLGRIKTELRSGGVWLWKYDNETLFYIHHDGLPEGSSTTLRQVRAGEGIIGRVAVRGRIMRVQNVEKDARHLCRSDVADAGLKSFYALPLMADRNIIGVLGLYFPPGIRIGVSEMNRMRSYARQLALALKVVKIYSELIKSNRELKKTQKLLVQNESLAAMGRLSRGIAHEVGNPLGVIISTTEYLLETKPDPAEVWECLDVIREKAEEMNGLVLDILELNRPGEYQLVPVAINEIIEKTLRFLKPKMRRQHVNAKVDVETAIPWIYADPTKMGQVFINLFLNALDVMPKGGVLTVRAWFESPTSEVVIVVEDTGPGIDEEDLNRVFTPFFSKKQGGTGLGLAITHQIINRHNGFIWAENRLEGGARFGLRLPIAASLK